MSREDVKDEIEANLEDPVTITAEDLEPPVCTWCGIELSNDMTIAIWDIKELGDDAVWRHQYCSKGCREEDKESTVTEEETHPYGDPTRIPLEEYEKQTNE